MKQSVLYSNREFIVSSAFPRALRQRKRRGTRFKSELPRRLLAAPSREAIVSA
jgi:hypothetical protein